MKNLNEFCQIQSEIYPANTVEDIEIIEDALKHIGINRARIFVTAAPLQDVETKADDTLIAPTLRFIFPRG
jgi:hypothetical protein